MSDINEMNVGPRWYVAHTYSGYENMVKVNLEKIIENRGLEHLIYDIRIPVETTVEPGGEGAEDKIIENKIFPGYVLVKMTMTDESWHVVRNITGVTGFVGPGSEPTPLTDEEVNRFNVETRTQAVEFTVGKKVSVISGVFEGYSDIIQEVKEDASQVVVLVQTERREIPFNIDMKDVRITE